MHMYIVTIANGSLARWFRANWLPWTLLVVGLVVIAADPVVVPTGLNPGDQYRLVFLTTDTISGDVNDLSVYNTHVTNAATGEGRTGRVRHDVVGHRLNLGNYRGDICADQQFPASWL